jgi:hypothetical protein
MRSRLNVSGVIREGRNRSTFGLLSRVLTALGKLRIAAPLLGALARLVLRVACLEPPELVLLIFCVVAIVTRITDLAS